MVRYFWLNASQQGTKDPRHEVSDAARGPLCKRSSFVFSPMLICLLLVAFFSDTQGCVCVITAEFAEFLRHCRGLEFEERPKYDLMRELLRSRFAKEGYVADYMFDWTLVKLKLYEDTLCDRAALVAPSVDDVA